MSQQQRDQQQQGQRPNRPAPQAAPARNRNRIRGPTSALTSFLRVNFTLGCCCHGTMEC